MGEQSDYDTSLTQLKESGEEVWVEASWTLRQSQGSARPSGVLEPKLAIRRVLSLGTDLPQSPSCVQGRGREYGNSFRVGVLG